MDPVTAAVRVSRAAEHVAVESAVEPGAMMLDLKRMVPKKLGVLRLLSERVERM
jgi:hypothetical protein